MTVTGPWWTLAGAPEAIGALYAQPPELFGVDLVAARLLREDAALELEFDLPRFPDRAPRSWPAQADAARIVVRFSGLHEVALAGWQPTGDLVIRPDANGVACALVGKGLRLDGSASKFDIVSVTGWVRARPRYLFGDPADFALEVEPEPPPDRTNWAAMRAWAQGHPIGDLEQADTMSPAARCLHRAAATLTVTEDDRSYASLAPDAAFRRIEHDIWDDEVDAALSQRRYDRHLFLAGSGGSQFDGHRVFVIRLADDRLRFLHRTLGGQLRCPEATGAAFRGAIDGFLRWYEGRCDETGAEIPAYPRLTPTRPA